MSYRSLRVQDFRSYDDFSVTFSDAVTIIVGPNGSGKTNLLEALYVLSAGTSFRVSDKDLVRHDQPWWRLEAQYNDDARVATYDTQVVKQQKQFVIAGSKHARLGHTQKLPVVLFEPEHLRLLHGSPSRRRDYLDSLLARLQPDYARLRSRFERVLLQRNNILKEAARLHSPAAWLDDQLFAWDISFADLAQAITERRHGLVAYINQQLAATYSNIAHQQATVQMVYQPTVEPEDYKSQLVTKLRAIRGLDVRRGHTGVGPHRDDMIILLNGAEAGVTASRGEVRTLVLALKMIEIELTAAQSTHPPLLLFDDVFSELDSVRRTELARLAQRYQTVITTTDADMVTKEFVVKHIIKTGDA